MNSFVLRVNCNHLRALVNQDYLSVRHHLCCCVIATLCMTQHSGLLTRHLEFEDRYYQQLYLDAHVCSSAPVCMAQLELDRSPYQFLEIHDYAEEFFRMKLHENKRNYLSVTIDSGYHLVVGIKNL